MARAATASAEKFAPKRHQIAGLVHPARCAPELDWERAIMLRLALSHRIEICLPVASPPLYSPPNQGHPKRYGFLVLPRFSLLSLACVTDVLRVANTLLGGRAHEFVLLSSDGQPVAAAGGEVVVPGYGLDAMPVLSGLFLVAETVPDDIEIKLAEAQLAKIRIACAQIELINGVLGGVGSGAAWLAHAGFLHGRRCTLSAAHVQAVKLACPEVMVSAKLYEIESNRLSCAGASSGLDLMICWLGRCHGERLSQRLLQHFGLERLRDAGERQLQSSAAPMGSSVKLAEAVALMEANLGEPLSTEEIAGLVGVSRRQLERLFKQHLDTLPSRWYLEQRLTRARRMLVQTSQSILQIGLSCGFTSGAHFSNAYRQFFNYTPRDERSARAAAWRTTAPGHTDAPAADPITQQNSAQQKIENAPRIRYEPTL